MSKDRKVIYYTNELTDEFSTAQIEARTIGDDYKYLGTWARPLARLVFYYAVARPLGFLFIKLKFGHKVVNREVLKQVKGKGYFLYGNHTNAGADPFIPQSVDINRDLYIIVHPNNVSMPVLGRVTPSLGALPLPDTMGAAKNLNKALKTLMDKKKTVLIYPEAHIWPYYTGIRPFGNASFGYPVQLGVPVFCFTNTYQKRKHRKTPRMVTYIDGPFYADSELPKAKQKEQLRNRVYEAMINRSKNSNIEVVKYIKKSENVEKED